MNAPYQPALLEIPKPESSSLPVTTGSNEPELIFSIEIPGRLQSWNQILGMEHWERYKFKDALQADFLYELQASAKDSSTKTTCARNTILTAAATLASYRETARQLRKSKLAKKKLSRAQPKLSELKSSESAEKVPF